MPRFNGTVNVLLFIFTLTAGGCSCSSVSYQNDYAERVREIGGTAELKIDFSESDITDEDLKGMDFPDNLVEINLANTAITDEGVVQLKRATNLSSVVLAHTKITEKSLEHLKEMPNLQTANIANKRIPFEKMIEFTKHLNDKQRGAIIIDAYETSVYGPPPDESQ